MTKLTSSVGGILVLISGAVTWLFILLALIQLWGFLGFVASFIFTPGVVIFPFNLQLRNDIFDRMTRYG